MHYAGLVLFLFCIFLLTLIRRAEVRIDALSWFRALVPSWRFFDRPGDEPLLYVRVEQNGIWGEWVSVFRANRPRSPLDLFYNPRSTTRLALHSLFEFVLAELSTEVTLIKFSQSASYALLKNAAEYSAREQSESARRFQFRLVTKNFPEGKLDECFTSLEHEVFS